MRQPNEERLPVELEEFGQRLRDERPQPSPLELDRIKTRAMTQASRATSPRMKGRPMKSRLASILVVAGLLVGGTTGVLAATGGIPGSGGTATARQTVSTARPPRPAPASPSTEKAATSAAIIN